jgi:hypothetical protein
MDKKKYETFVKAYEDESSIGDKDAMMTVFHIDVEDPASIEATLTAMLKKIRSEKFIAQVAEECSFPRFAVVEDKVVKHEYFDSAEVYRKAVQHEYLRPLLKEICDEIITEQLCHSADPLWENDDDILGVVPAIALAMEEQQYLWPLTRLLFSTPQGEFSRSWEDIEAIITKWGGCLDTGILFATICIATRLDGVEWYINRLMELCFEEYLKDDEAMDMFLRNLYGHIFSNDTFQKSLDGGPGAGHWRDTFNRVYMPPVLRGVFHIAEDKIPAVAKKLSAMIAAAEIPTIALIRNMSES